MAETWATPEPLALADADALAGTVHERTQIAFLPLSTSPTSTPTLSQQFHRIANDLRVGLSAIMNGMCRKVDTLTIACNPHWYRKADGTNVHYEAGATELILTASQTNYVYLDHATNTLAASIVGWPADITTFTPLAIYVCDGSDITTSDEDADVRSLLLYQAHASSTSPTGTTATAFTLDSDNAGAGVDQQVRYNRGSTDAEDAAVEWDETNNRFNLISQHTSGTECPVSASEFQIGGTAVLTSDGAAKVQAAVAGSGLTHAAGVLAANVDGTTIEISADALQVKDGGIDTGKLSAALADQLGQVTIGDASGASPLTITLQVKDINGDNLAEVCLVEVGVYQDEYGAATATDATIAVGGAGTLVRTVTANKVLICRTDATGLLQLTITDATTESVYILAGACTRSKILDCSDKGTAIFT